MEINTQKQTWQNKATKTQKKEKTKNDTHWSTYANFSPNITKIN